MKKTIFIFLLLFFFSVLNSFSQNGRLWATYYGGSAEDIGCTTATDVNGNVYIGGNTISTSGIAVGGFQNTYGGGNVDGFLAKFDANGNRLWATYYGGGGDDNIACVITDAFGNVYAAGTTSTNVGMAFGGFSKYLWWRRR